MFRRVGKFLAHAVIVVSEITERDNGAVNDRRGRQNPPPNKNK
jgi:hypothetical protein